MVILAEIGGEARVALEATFGWEWLAELLEADEHELNLAHPLRTQAIAAARDAAFRVLGPDMPDKRADETANRGLLQAKVLLAGRAVEPGIRPPLRTRAARLGVPAALCHASHLSRTRSDFR